MRLPNSYYTQVNMDGVAAPEDNSPQEPPTFYQGEDVIFEKYLAYGGNPILQDDWEIIAKVKKTTASVGLFWVGEQDCGIYKTEAPGFYKIVVPANVTSTLLAGTYWLGVTAQQNMGTGEIVDLHLDMGNDPFYIAYSVSSPNTTTLNRADTELTQPKSLDTRGL